jgi:hypothetical protein
MINTDSYYEIGAGHTFCQDYADNGVVVIGERKFHYAVVCDGCSASKDSDFGARWLAKYFPRALRIVLEINGVDTRLTPGLLRATLLASIGNVTPHVPLPAEAFDATVVAIVYDEKADLLYSFAWGDGKIYYKLKTDDSGTLTDISFKSNAPYYLNYSASPERELLYEDRFGKDYADVTPHIVTPQNVIVIQERIKLRQKFFCEVVDNASSFISYASVFTDGVDTYHRKDDVNTVMARNNVFNQLTQYKNVHGEFVKRRMQMVKKFCQKEGWQHFDDISVATINIS